VLNLYKSYLKTIITYKVLFFLLLFTNALTSIGQTSFSANKPSGCAPLKTVFSANTSTAVQWLWEFGNGNSSTLENPAAQYILPGNFTVKLTVWDANGTSLVYDSIGTVPGNLFVFVDSAIMCHQEYTYKIKAYDIDTFSKRTSYSDTCKAKPFYFNIVNPPVFTRATVVDGVHVNLKWEEIYPNRNPIIYYDIERKLPGGFFDFNTSQTGNLPLSLDDYKTKVDRWSYTYQMRSIDACYDTSEYTSIAKSILLKTYINEDFEPILYWTHYKQWPEGVEKYVVEKRISNDTFREIGRVTAQDTLYRDKFSALNCEDAFDYRVYAIRPNDTGTRVVLSYSNYSSPSVKTKIFVPNAFSPNQNKLNETFHPTGIFIKKYTMKIYNRWGEKVYDNDQCMNAWDGVYMGKPAQEGVYAYKIVAVGMNNEIFHLAGDVTLLR